MKTEETVAKEKEIVKVQKKTRKSVNNKHMCKKGTKKEKREKEKRKN